MTSPGSDRQRGLGRIPEVTALGLIVVFIGASLLLITMRSDRNWDRLMYLLSGLEAIVYAGAGALFGTTVHRGSLNAARQEAAAAQEAAKGERARADSAEGDATRGRMLSAAIEAKMARVPQPALTVRGGRPDELLDNGAVHPDLAELAALARSLFPKESGSPRDGHTGSR